MEIYAKLLNLDEPMELRTIQLDHQQENEDETNAPIYDQLYDAIGAEFGLDAGSYSLMSNSGCRLMPWSSLQRGDVVKVFPVVLGGKGGFGSLLRAFGKQITMSTNKDACRDLTGRRIKQVNNEKKMREFMEKQAELAKKKEEAKLEKRKRRRKKLEKIQESSTGRHIFVDPKYDEQKQKIAQELEEALDRGMSTKTTKNGNDSSEDKACTSKEAAESESSGEEVAVAAVAPIVIEEKRDKKKEETVAAAAKKKDIDSKLIDWMGVGDVDVSSSSSDDDAESEQPVKKLKKV